MPRTRITQMECLDWLLEQGIHDGAFTPSDDLGSPHIESGALRYAATQNRSQYIEALNSILPRAKAEAMVLFTWMTDPTRREIW